MTGNTFIDPPGRRTNRRAFSTGLLALVGASVAALFLLLLIEMLRAALGCSSVVR